MEFYKNSDGDIGVLISPGYGAGWQTWNSHKSINMALDKRVIEKWLEVKDLSDGYERLKKWFESLDIGEIPYLGGYDDLELKFVKPGTTFCITEYDGFESISIVCRADGYFTV